MYHWYNNASPLLLCGCISPDNTNYHYENSPMPNILVYNSGQIAYIISLGWWCCCSVAKSCPALCKVPASKNTGLGHPWGPVVKKPPSNAEDAGSIPGQGIKIPYAVEQLSPHALEPTHSNWAHTAEFKETKKSNPKQQQNSQGQKS